MKTRTADNYLKQADVKDNCLRYSENHNCFSILIHFFFRGFQPGKENGKYHQVWLGYLNQTRFGNKWGT